VQGFERGCTAAILRATYTITDSLRVRAGHLLIAGSRDTLLGQFHDNDDGFVELRWSLQQRTFACTRLSSRSAPGVPRCLNPNAPLREPKPVSKEIEGGGMLP
jgi:hypothetical protein